MKKEDGYQLSEIFKFFKKDNIMVRYCYKHIPNGVIEMVEFMDENSLDTMSKNLWNDYTKKYDFIKINKISYLKHRYEITKYNSYGNKYKFDLETFSNCNMVNPYRLYGEKFVLRGGCTFYEISKFIREFESNQYSTFFRYVKVNMKKSKHNLDLSELI